MVRFTDKEYKCICPLGYTGEHCEKGKVRVRLRCHNVIMFTNACMHLYRFRFGLVSYASKCRLVTCESSLCPFRVSLLTSRFKPSYFVLLWSSLVQGNCFPLEDLLAELKTDQTLKLRLQGKATGKNCTGNNEIPVSIQSCLVFFLFLVIFYLLVHL